MKRGVLILAAFAVIAGLVVAALTEQTVERTPLAELKEKYSKKKTPSVDHTKFAELKKHFNKPQEVTAACIECHNERHTEVMATSHWNWERLEYIEGKGIRSVGKKNILNNNCIGIAGNEQSCNKCHIGYGYDGPTFDFNNPLNVDCLACHDNSNEYVKAPGGAGMPDPAVNLSKVAQSVGRPQRENCGTCHFFGGGGNNVKHGDLEQALFDAPRTVDVHMGTDGANMSCVDCHTAEKHQILGKVYSLSSMNRNRVECETCHTALPHNDDILNDHTMKVACQTCHIPTYAKVNSTKLWWDWSTAGDLKDGKPYEVKDSLGDDLYLSIKGSFRWGRNVKPEYAWFNGTASHYLLGDTVDPSTPLVLNKLYGEYTDPDAKIIPVKVMRGKQLYDNKFRYLIQPKTVSTRKGDGGFWAEFNWKRAAEEGAKRRGMAFSGDYGFVPTEMNWPVNHMVAPANEAVSCAECHTRDDGRLEKLNGFYMPGRDYSPFVEFLGGGIVALTLGAVVLHGGLRFASRRKRQVK